MNRTTLKTKLKMIESFLKSLARFIKRDGTVKDKKAQRSIDSMVDQWDETNKSLKKLDNEDD
jgi:hypothetical protein